MKTASILILLASASPLCAQQSAAPPPPEPPAQTQPAPQPTSGPALDLHSVEAPIQQAPQKSGVPVKISTGIMNANLLVMVPPVYPRQARDNRIEGTVILRVIVGKKGSVESIGVAAGPALLRQAAIDAVKQWRYKPVTINGAAAEVITTVNVNFRL